MMSIRNIVLLGLVGTTLPLQGVAQAPQKAPTSNPQAAAKRGLSLAESGHCKEALQILRRSTGNLPDKDLKLRAGLATVRCAMSLDRTDAAVEAVQMLNREFPHDPDVLYVTTHTYSDLSTRASLELARTAPNSYQAHEMNAESFELQGKWDDAEKEYQAILQQNANIPGIHFRIGRVLLSRPNPAPDSAAKARQEFQRELEIDPHNAGAEYILGELARQESKWQEAAEHFARATKADVSFADAYLALGMTLISDAKPADAIPPLETYARLQPGNPAGHYQLAMAYSRSGRKEDAKREAALQRETSQKIEQVKQQAADAQRQTPGPREQKPEPPK